ncbi:MAG: hypothetical protein AB7G75_01265 [Candidatus Binatia bacterium]
MNLHYSSQARVEQLLVLGRVILATFSLFAVWLDPTEPAKHVQVTYVVLGGYAIYALLLTLLAQRADTLLVRFRLLTHSIDFVAFCVFIYLTEAPNSPFFVYFVFSLLCATLRWQWRGTVWTAVATLVAFLGMGGYVAEILGDPIFELDRFIIRSVYLLVIATLLGYLGVHEQQLHNELSKLAAWPSTFPKDAHTLVQDMLAHAADIFATARILMVWEEREEPRRHVASWSTDRFDWTREPPATFEPLVAEPLATTSFFCQNVHVPVPTVVSLRRWRTALVRCTAPSPDASALRH